MYLIVLRLMLLFGLLSLIYIALSAYDRYATRERLKAEHQTGKAGGVSREDYINQGMAHYERSWQRKLLYGVFLVPFIAILILIYVANYL